MPEVHASPIAEAIAPLLPPNTVEPAAGQGLTLDVLGKVPVRALPYRFLSGYVASDGSITQGSQFAVAKGATGLYTITFTEVFKLYPHLSFNVITGGCFAASTTLAKTSVIVSIWDANAAAARDCAFTFMAVGS